MIETRLKDSDEVISTQIQQNQVIPENSKEEPYLPKSMTRPNKTQGLQSRICTLGTKTKLKEEGPKQMGLWARSRAQGLNNQDQEDAYRQDDSRSKKYTKNLIRTEDMRLY